MKSSFPISATKNPVDECGKGNLKFSSRQRYTKEFFPFWELSVESFRII
jgi:hypothetical protein